MGFFPLITASEKRHLNVVKVLLEHGADTNVHTNDGASALQMACQQDEMEIVKLFLEHGADLNILGFQNQTPLGAACLFGQLEIVRLLIARGADVNLGLPPILLACSELGGEGRTHIDLLSFWDRKYEIVKLLVEQGVNVNVAHPQSGLLPWQSAHLCKQEKIVWLLLDHIIEKDSENEEEIRIELN